MNNFDTFAQTYTEELEKAVLKFPEEYVWPVDQVPVVAAKMIQAFRAGTYNKDGKAIKNTCKRLNIPYTYKGINAYIGAA